MDEFSSRRDRRELERQQFKSQENKAKMREMFRRGMIWFSVIAGIGAFVGLMIFLVSQSSAPSGSGPVAAVTDTDWSKGGKDAKVTVVEYGDFQCPACGSYYPIVKNLNKEFGDKLRIVFRHFPLTQIHPNAQMAAQAAEAAGLHGKFWEMHDLLFEKQKDWSSLSDPKPKFRTYAEQIGLDGNQFDKDLTSAQVKDLVAEDVRTANAAKVNATPTFFLNGASITSPGNYDAFRTLINKELDKNS